MPGQSGDRGRERPPGESGLCYISVCFGVDVWFYCVTPVAPFIRLHSLRKWKGTNNDNYNNNSNTTTTTTTTTNNNNNNNKNNNNNNNNNLIFLIVKKTYFIKLFAN